MKYRPSEVLCKFGGKLLASQIELLFPSPRWDLIVPIPSSRQNLKERHFNQCALIAKELVKTGVGQASFDSLLHTGYRNVQASLTPTRRISNVKDAFSCNQGIVADKTILLVDDVITTGATTNFACRALFSAGAAQIDIVALARADGWNSYRKNFC